jgi:TIR domain
MTATKTQKPKRREIFFSYAHEDTELMHEVRRHLVLFDRQKIIRKWHDRLITPGTDWKKTIDWRLEQADIILLFVSPHFFDSDYCYEREMKQALRQHDRRHSRVIPIIARPCAWSTAPFAHLQALPTDGKPITRWRHREDACLNVAEGIMKVVMEMNTFDAKATA